MSDRETGTYMMTVEDIADFVVDACRDWYDGAETPEMTALAYRTSSPNRNIDVGALIKEFELCISTCTLVDEKPALENAARWLRGVVEHASLLHEIEELVFRCHASGMDRGEFEAACSKAWHLHKSVATASVPQSPCRKPS